MRCPQVVRWAMAGAMILTVQLSDAREPNREPGGMSFLEYLGTMIEEDGEWLDPTLLIEQETGVETNAVDVSAKQSGANDGREPESLPTAGGLP